MSRSRICGGLVAVAAGLAACASGGDVPAADTSKVSIAPTASSPAAAGPSTTARFQPLAPGELQRALDTARTSYGAPGAVAVVVSETSRWTGTSGTADVDGTPITDATRLRIASITKRAA